MTLFLITFLSLYGGMHAYAFVRLRAAFLAGPASIAGPGGMDGADDRHPAAGPHGRRRRA